MAAVRFSKWEGTGNDFIVIDDRDGRFPVGDLQLVRSLCDRHFGIGSDGLILLQNGEGVDYRMEFLNPDGSRSFCGNGSRCAYAFWSALTGSRGPARFMAIDGLHEAGWKGEQVRISLGPVEAIRTNGGADNLHNGSPHELVWVPDPGAIDIDREGAARAHAPAHQPGGTNVNFVRTTDRGVEVRTFERGVEAETLSCGTGVVASALSAIHRGKAHSPVAVITRGGALSVEAETLAGGGWRNIWLTGPVRRVFEGEWDPAFPPAS